MNKSNHPEIKFIPKNWGFEKEIVNTEEFCGKILFFAKGRNGSLHSHRLKSEFWYVNKGRIKISFTDDLRSINELVENKASNREILDFCDTVVLSTGDTFNIPKERLHRVYALEDTEIFEVSTQHFDSDSYRIIKSN